MVDFSNQKLYVLSIPKKKTVISKIGETQIDMKKRITAFGMGGKWKGMENLVKVELEIPTLLAPTIERRVKKILKGKWKDKQVKDKNMGRGYTEWYDIPPSSMKGIVFKSIHLIYKEDRLLKRKLKGAS
tara:strand:+ start:1173 stop:1559 length:387 start_codon:yes stop_codon:yes gene_type:complete